MKPHRKPPTVLDEREVQEMYRIEHCGLWGMYALLCVVIGVQLVLGMGLRQVAGEVATVGVVSAGLIVAYARRGIWDAHARPSTVDNARYAALCGLVVAAVCFAVRVRALIALGMGVAAFALCFALLEGLMRYVRRRQQAQADALERDDTGKP